MKYLLLVLNFFFLPIKESYAEFVFVFHIKSFTNKSFYLVEWTYLSLSAKAPIQEKFGWLRSQFKKWFWVKDQNKRVSQQVIQTLWRKWNKITIFVLLTNWDIGIHGGFLEYGSLGSIEAFVTFRPLSFGLLGSIETFVEKMEYVCYLSMLDIR